MLALFYCATKLISIRRNVNVYGYCRRIRSIRIRRIQQVIQSIVLSIEYIHTHIHVRVQVPYYPGFPIDATTG
jgi:hypothetical protein